jgi:hypothetical protein
MTEHSFSRVLVACLSAVAVPAALLYFLFTFVFGAPRSLSLFAVLVGGGLCAVAVTVGLARNARHFGSSRSEGTDTRRPGYGLPLALLLVGVLLGIGGLWLTLRSHLALGAATSAASLLPIYLAARRLRRIVRGFQPP